MKTNNIPLKSPLKIQIELQKKNQIFQNLFVFRAFLEKVGFFSNLKPVNIFNQTFRKASSLIFTENKGLADKLGHHLMPAMPIFQNHGFFEKGSNSQQFLKTLKKFFAFLVAFL